MRLALVALCLLLSATSFSQAIPEFHLNLGLGLAIPIAGEPGLLLAIEPKYGISQAVDVGLRYEAATMRRTTDRTTIQYYGPSQTTQSLLLTSTFTLKGKRLRPFFGAGLGLYFVPNASVSNSGSGYQQDDSAPARIGGLLRAGVKLKRLGLGLDYSLIPPMDAYTPSLSYYSGSAQLVNHYLGLKLGVDIGGQRP